MVYSTKIAANVVTAARLKTMRGSNNSMMDLGFSTVQKEAWNTSKIGTSTSSFAQMLDVDQHLSNDDVKFPVGAIRGVLEPLGAQCADHSKRFGLAPFKTFGELTQMIQKDFEFIGAGAFGSLWKNGETALKMATGTSLQDGYSYRNALQSACRIGSDAVRRFVSMFPLFYGEFTVAVNLVPADTKNQALSVRTEYWTLTAMQLLTPIHFVTKPKREHRGEALVLIKQIIPLIKQLHGIGLMHMDVKAANLLIHKRDEDQKSWELKLGDVSFLTSVNSFRPCQRGSKPWMTDAGISGKDIQTPEGAMAQDIYGSLMIIINVLFKPAGEREFVDMDSPGFGARMLKMRDSRNWLWNRDLFRATDNVKRKLRENLASALEMANTVEELEGDRLDQLKAIKHDGSRQQFDVTAAQQQPQPIESAPQGGAETPALGAHEQLEAARERLKQAVIALDKDLDAAEMNVAENTLDQLLQEIEKIKDQIEAEGQDQPIQQTGQETTAHKDPIERQISIIKQEESMDWSQFEDSLDDEKEESESTKAGSNLLNLLQRYDEEVHGFTFEVNRIKHEATGRLASFAIPGVLEKYGKVIADLLHQVTYD